MQRLLPFRPHWLTLSIASLLVVATADRSWAQTQPNPLRAAAKPVTAAAPSAVGTAVRTAKRTPTTPVAVEAPTLQPVPKHRPTQTAATVQRPSQPQPQPRAQSQQSRPSGQVAPAAYRHRTTRSPNFAPSGYSQNQAPMGESVLNGTVTVQPRGTVMEGETIYADGGEMFAGDMFEGMPGDDCCNSCSGSGCGDCCLIPCPRIPWDDLTVFGGVQGFTGPKNLGEAGSFGFHEGFNWGAPVPCFDGCLGMQAGARFTQDNLSGASFTSDTRHQVFITGGLFRRVDWGLQGGVVFDYLSDDWYTNTDLTQIRAEVSWVLPCSHELGFWMATSAGEDQEATRILVNQIPVDGIASWEATDLYAFFYRHQFVGWEGASGRLFAGFSGESDGFIGTDIQVPLTCDLALQAGFSYLVPEEAKGPADVGNSEEAWNVAISLVWYPGCGSATSKSYFAPLFNVADNGSFMADRVD